MKNYDVILFDLDGTITQPFEGITNSVAYALSKFGIEVEDRRVLALFIGPPLLDAFMEYYGFSRADALKAVEYYRENYSVKGIFEADLYDGAREMLEGCKRAGKTVVLATAKPEAFAFRVLEKFGVSEYFDVVAGASFDTSRKDKEAVIAYALEKLGGTDKSRALMVGDRRHDAEGAAANGIKCLGVTYGYGSREELLESGVIKLASSPREVLEIITG